MEYRPNPERIYLSSSYLSQNQNRPPITYSHSGLSYLEAAEDPDCCDVCFGTSKDTSPPGNGSCIVSIVFISIGIVAFLAGLVATLLHYGAGLIFEESLYRGRLIGPLLLGLSVVPIVLGAMFALKAKRKVKEFSQQIRAEESIISRKMHRDIQSRQATESVIGESALHYSHMGSPQYMDIMHSYGDRTSTLANEPLLRSGTSNQSMTIARPMKARHAK
ncbi:hypothetical protein Ciccas_005301 [Cichlidogyrus casuarinus]|uniref:Transmembrane protein n=1 Tax=Cichlidogyrus casuarinus TaxID=1844966 RepID=A0ABD2Q9G4_9PLAT